MISETTSVFNHQSDRSNQTGERFLSHRSYVVYYKHGRRMVAQNSFQSSKTELQALCQSHNINQLAILSSVLPESGLPENRIILLIELTFEATIDVSSAQEEFERLIRSPVVLVLLKQLKPALRNQILISAQIVYPFD